jgi:hypothetical protein
VGSSPVGLDGHYVAIAIVGSGDVSGMDAIVSRGSASAPLETRFEAVEPPKQRDLLSGV